MSWCVWCRVDSSCVVRRASFCQVSVHVLCGLFSRGVISGAMSLGMRRADFATGFHPKRLIREVNRTNPTSLQCFAPNVAQRLPG